MAIAWVRLPRPRRRRDEIEARRAASEDPCSMTVEVDWFREACDKFTLKTVKRGIQKERKHLPDHRIKTRGDFKPTFQETVSKRVRRCTRVA